MLLYEVYFNKTIWVASSIQQPVLQDDITYPFGSDFRKIVDQMEHLVSILCSSISLVTQGPCLQHKHNPPRITGFHSVSKIRASRMKRIAFSNTISPSPSR